MKTKEVSVTVSRTFNLGNYESLRVEAGAVVTLEEGDTAAAASASALDDARASLREQHVALHPKKAS